MKDRLTEILKSCFKGTNSIEELADKLIAEGVIVPPCKVGDFVYQTDSVRVYPLCVSRVIYDTDGIAFDERAIGKAVFLTHEEAEKALERSKNGT